MRGLEGEEGEETEDTGDDLSEGDGPVVRKGMRGLRSSSPRVYGIHFPGRIHRPRW